MAPLFGKGICGGECCRGNFPKTRQDAKKRDGTLPNRFLVVVLPVLIGLIIPVGVLFYWLVRGLFNDQELLPLLIPARNSLYVSLVAALVTVVAALPVTILVVRFKSRLSRLIDRSTYIGFGLPGVVVALSLVFFAINVALPLYQSIWLLVFAYGVLFP